MLVNSITGIALDAVLTRLLPAGLVAATNIATGTCALVATADWGPVNVPTAVASLNDYVAQFGNYAQSGAYETTGYAQAWGFFTGGKKRRISGGGSDLRVIRIAGTGNAAATSTVLDNLAATVGTVTGLYPGASGNGIQRIIADGDNRLAVPAAPAVTAETTGGTIPTEAAVVVALTAVNNRGETTIGATSNSVAVTGPSGSITVPLPALATYQTGWNVYTSTNGGTSWELVNTGGAVTGATYTIAALGAGAAPPSTNGAVSSFHLTVVPFNDQANEVYKNLTPASAAAAVNGLSQFVTWTAGASTLLPTPGTAYLQGGNSGLSTQDTDYVGTAGVSPTGFQLAATVSGVDFLISGSMSAAIQTAMKAIADQVWAQAIIGPENATITTTAAIVEETFNDWGVIYLYGYQNWLNPVSGVTEQILPAGSVAGALCNGPYWVNLSQCTLNGYLGPVTPLSDADAELLAEAGIIPITAGSVCRKGCNTASDPSINQIEDFRIPVFIAKSADATVQPLIAEPQVVDPTTGQSDFFDDIREALESLLRQQPKEAITEAYVDAQYDSTLASENKAQVSVVVRQTGKANQILLNATVGRTALAVVPAGVNLITGS